MIAEIIPEAYDAVGRKVLRPDLRRKGVHPTFPMGRYVSQPSTVNGQSIPDIRKFLTTCKDVSDEEQFGKDDYWRPPEHFEQTRKGDCDRLRTMDLATVSGSGLRRAFCVGSTRPVWHRARLGWILQRWEVFHSRTTAERSGRQVTQTKAT